jgi:thiol-disulfide isomerase/thioredoxin
VGPRLSIVLGLLSGVLVASIGAVALFALLPSPAPAASASPTPAPTSAASATATATTVSASPSATPAISIAPGPSASGSPTVFHVGGPAPVLAVPRVGGGTIDLAALRGRPVWVNFMQTTCPPCVDEFPVMSGFAARHEDDGLVVVAIDIREAEATVAAFADSLNAAFPVGLDVDGAAQRAWGAYALPVHFWIDDQGIVRHGALGGIGADVMADGLRTILPGIEVTP